MPMVSTRERVGEMNVTNAFPSKPLLLLFPTLLCSCTPNRPHEYRASAGTEPTRSSELTNDAQIKVTVIEHLIRNEVKPPAGTVCLVSLGRAECSELAKRLPSYRIEPRKAAKPSASATLREEPPLVLSVGWMQIDGAVAKVRAGYSKWTDAVFEFRVNKNHAWRVEEVTGPILVN